MAIKFVEVVVSSHNTNEISEDITVKNLNEREMAGMQYLAGYVLRTVYSRLHQEKDSLQREQVLALLLACKTSYIPGDKLCFIDELSRGGLWKVSEDVERIFHITEKYFSMKTASKSLRYIPIDTYVDTLMDYPPLSLTFNNAVGSCEISVEESVKIDIL